MQLRSRLVAAAVVVALTGVLCAAGLSLGRPIEGVPVGTPLWLGGMIRSTATSYGDPTPQTIVVKLGIHDSYGRVLDRVTMKGDFSCNGCTTGLAGSSWQGKIVGFTVSARTHQVLSYSLHRG